MIWHRLILLAALAILGVVPGLHSASAKGLNGLVGATISSGGLPKQVEVSLSSSSEDYWWDVVTDDSHPSFDQLSYEITLHFNLTGKEGCPDEANPCAPVGLQDAIGVGRFDGNDLLYFADGLKVGNGMWSRGWYRASPVLAQQLRAAITPTLSAPSTGDGGLVGANE